MGILRKITLNAKLVIKKRLVSFFQFLIFTNLTLLAANTTNIKFKSDETPIIRSIQVESPGNALSGYVGCKIIITGVNFIDVTAVRVNKSPVPIQDYTVVNETTIIFNAIPATGFIEVLTRANGGAIYATAYKNLGYITVAAGNWNQDSTWLNKKVPPNLEDTVVTIAHTVKATSGILNVGELTIAKTGELKLSAILDLYGSCINKGALDIEGTFRMHKKSSFNGDTPVYSYSSILHYKAYKGDVQNEWIGNGTSAGTGTPSSVVLSDGAEIRIASGKRSLESGISIGDNCTFTVDSSDITIGGHWDKSDSGVFNPGSGSITFRGLNEQQIIGNNTFNNIIINNSNGVVFVGPTSISATLTFILGKVILKENDLTMQQGATIKGYNNRRYIVCHSNGKLWQKMHAATGTVYPIGNKSYNPVTFNTVSKASYGVRIIDSIPPVFDKERMINRMWVISSLSDAESINISAQYNRTEKGKHFDSAKPIMGFYSNGWNTNEAVLTEAENAVIASTTNLTIQSKEQYLLIGNITDIKVIPEPVVIAIKEPEPEPHTEIHFDVLIRPNPFITSTKITITSPDEEKTIKIYDATGKLMLTETLKGAGVQRITVGNDFPSGVYTAVVMTKNNKKTKTIRIIKR